MRVLHEDIEPVAKASAHEGTWVNGTKVQRAVLEDGDVIEAASALFVFRTALETRVGTGHRTWAEIQNQPPGFRTFLPDLELQFEQLKRVAPSVVPILLLGPTGAGKEVLARAVHEASGRKGAFVAVNCGALPSALVEGLLFGHLKGAFSGALKDEAGLVRAADGGTLLLDEIADLPAAAQGTLLRVLQEGEVLPLGATRPVRVDIRVIAATHKPLEDFVQKGTFRTDLFARLAGSRIPFTPSRSDARTWASSSPMPSRRPP